MQDQKRQLFLEKKWKKYPQMRSSALSVRAFQSHFSKITLGKFIPKTQDFQLAGRVQINSLGKNESGEISVESQGEKIQLEVLNPIEILDVLASGDHVLVDCRWTDIYVENAGFESRPVKIRAHSLHLLAPALTPPQKLNLEIKRARQWQFFLSLIRKTFDVLEFTEVRTPTLVPSPGTEPFLDHFTTEFKSQAKSQTYFLPTSPELHLKKMLTRGWTKIYEFKSCFRNNELSEHHQPEFLMLEWYRAYSNLDHIEKDIAGIFNYLKLHWSDPVTSFGFLTSTTVQDLFQKYCDFNLTPKTDREELANLAKKFEIKISDSDSWNDIFFRIFLEKIESNLGMAGPVVVKNYPPSQAALARLTPDGWAARLEVYWKGLEIANAFDELNDPDEQRRRCQHDNQLRKLLKKAPVPIDEEFLNALDCGLPPSAGIALGVDRLFMALINESQIAQTREFPILP